MELSNKILSDIIIFSKYARYVPRLERRETWDEIIDRNKNMHIKKYPHIKNKIEQVYKKFVYNKKVLPSMRSLQFASKPIEISPNRQYNCAFLPIDHWYSFAEIMFLLLGGSGVGYSVQFHHVDRLPELCMPHKRRRRHLIGDSIEGWATAVKVLMKAYFFGLSKPIFDYSDIREKGALLKTSGGRAPGPQPLKDCIHSIESVLDSKRIGDKLTPLEVHDIICFIADAVLSGGIRRAACAAMFSLGDEDMLTCKYGKWWEQNPQRGRANNSAVILRHRISKKDFLKLWEKIKLSGCGEPGFVFSNNKDMGFNPCFEAALRPLTFCNLVEINASNIDTQKELNARAEAGSFIATLQAGYTDFHFLRDEWQRSTERDALIGVSMTGIASGDVLGLNLEEAANVVVDTNKIVANLIGINAAHRATCGKPGGTTSLVLGCTSGISAGWSEHYIRRVVINKQEPIYAYLQSNFPDLMEDSFEKPNLESVLSIPIKLPRKTIFKDEESSSELLERVKKFNLEWVMPGHVRGDNKHNISCTVHIREHEWGKVGNWIWENRNFYTGLSVFPYADVNLPQMPFESCSKYMYEKMASCLKSIDLRRVVEKKDNTITQEQVACSGGNCEI